ncbi:hypothetical protein EDD63_14911 [Breznakia blatticola]|uniref:Uncharacterized protein n=1 Tax=Breznakia blatticola TaxID=1754012 RepID=A0A4R7ZCK9_9FIRM|nr:hypothetical protein [Breznakia blatticola]TDW13121.1 hypothetical protein EDD63_14911 [Breznakia blatticola]
MNEDILNQLHFIHSSCNELDIQEKILIENKEDLSKIYQQQQHFFDELLSSDYNKEVDDLVNEIMCAQKDSLNKVDDYQENLKAEKKKLLQKEESIYEKQRNSVDIGDTHYVY